MLDVWCLPVKGGGVLNCETDYASFGLFFVIKCFLDSLGYQHTHGKFQVCPTFLIYPILELTYLIIE